MSIKEWQGIWVIVEQIDGNLTSVSCELLGKAQELKDQLEAKPIVTAVILGEEVKKLVKELTKYGAEEIIIAEHPDLKYFRNESYALVLEEMIREYKPAVVLVGATGTGSDLAPTLGAKLRTGVAAHCIDLRMNAEGNLVSVVPAFGGKVLGDILCPNHRPQIATIKAGVVDKPSTMENSKSTIIDYNPNPVLNKDKNRLKVLGIYQEKVQGVLLENAEVVVAGGWGMGSKEDWGLLVELADLLGGAVGCTRPALDEGWAEGEHQMIGTSGKTIRPKVYIGAGISGATHHLCGMKDAGLIININKDENAQVFEASDIHIVGDAKTILCKLIEQLKCRCN